MGNYCTRNDLVDSTSSLSRQEMGSLKEAPLCEEILVDNDSRNRDDKLVSIESEVRSTEEMVTASEGLHELLFPDSPLTYDTDYTAYDAMQGGDRNNSHEVLVTHEASGIEITRKVFCCLSYGSWLNDEVIDVYLGLLKEREKREPNRFLKCHFFNTFFYGKLFSGSNSYHFEEVRRWTTLKKLGYELIECDKIFVPIHKDRHWCLGVINVKEESFQYLDSLGGMDTAVVYVLARYFMDEVKDKSGREIDTMSWKLEAVEGLPLQKNVWDCGMFMLKYADFYSRGSSLPFTQEHMEYFRTRTAEEILRLRAE